MKTDNSNNGLLPRIWGPPMWQSLHSITFGYPINPSEVEKKNYKQFFENVGNVLPCKYCSLSYNEFLKSEPTLLTDEVFQNRDSLTKWLFIIHERVNNKLEVIYDVTYEDIQKKYESFRAKCDPNLPGCVMPIEEKKQSYCNAYKHDCNILPYSIIIYFKSYAKERGVSDFDNIQYYKKVFDSRHDSDSQIEWDKRNDECYKIVYNMRINGIRSLELSGKYKDLPTIDELKLIARMSSNLRIDEIMECLNKLGFKIATIYKFQ